MKKNTTGLDVRVNNLAAMHAPQRREQLSYQNAKCLSLHERKTTVQTSNGLQSRSMRISNRFLFMNGNISNTYPSRLNHARISVMYGLSMIQTKRRYHLPPECLWSVMIVRISLIAASSYRFSLLLIFRATYRIHSSSPLPTCFPSSLSHATVTVLHLPTR